jgi:branched-chain amino acid transport system permease protein
VNSYRVILASTALVAALIAPLVTGQYWMSLITQVYIYGLLALSVDLLLGHAGLYSLCQASFFAVAAYTTAILQVRYGYPTIVPEPPTIAMREASTELWNEAATGLMKRL